MLSVKDFKNENIPFKSQITETYAGHPDRQFQIFVTLVEE